VLSILVLFGALRVGNSAAAWSNGGYSSDPNNPDYGTHDWIAEHAMNLLPANESGWLSSNKAAFLYGTEAPDNSGASFQGRSGYGDTANHHNYYSGSTCTDDSASQRASEEYQKALACLNNGSYAPAAWFAGAMAHYLGDMSVWAHVMKNESHHSDYENQVDSVTDSYSKNPFTVSSDGTLETVSAYNAATSLGLNTFNDGGSNYTALWMNSSFQDSWSKVSDWSTQYKARTAESISLAVNIIAAVLHTLTVEAGAGGTTSGTTGPGLSNELLIAIAVVVFLVIVGAFFARPKGRR
jgi:hypothetical protein